MFSHLNYEINHKKVYNRTHNSDHHIVNCTPKVDCYAQWIFRKFLHRGNQLGRPSFDSSEQEQVLCR